VGDVRAVVITRPGSPEVLVVEEVPDPVAGPGEVLIEVTATAVNRADLLQRQGHYPVPLGASPYLGLECSGTIAALGQGVTGWQVGDEVCALLAGGGYAELVAVPVGQLMPRPPHIPLVDAAGIPETACTVHSLVFAYAQLKAGETLLVHGGTSGIGTTLIQLAKAAGARVFTTVGTQRKLDFALELGADVAINYHEEHFDERVAHETGGAGVDVILDNMGAAYLERNVRSLGLDGRLVVLGLQGGRKGEIDLGALLARRISVYAAGLRARSAGQKAAIVAATQAFVWPIIESGGFRPVIDRVLSLDDAADAHRLLESSEHIGKVLLRVR
jgi:putative PIG3 family NAD(P)H quinone oxidoreductase